MLEALVACDPMGLGAADEEGAAEMVQLLQEVAPQADELQLIDDYLQGDPKKGPGDESLLAEVEAFFQFMRKVNGDLIQRLKCMELMVTLEARIFTAVRHCRCIVCSAAFAAQSVPFLVVCRSTS